MQPLTLSSSGIPSHVMSPCYRQIQAALFFVLQSCTRAVTCTGRHADSRFTGLARSAVSCGIDSPCALERCTFEGNAAGDDANVDPYEGLSAALDMPTAARARAQGCSFAGGGDDAIVAPGAALYTDSNATLTFSAATRGAVLPVACATEDVEALSADAPAFVALREVRRRSPANRCASLAPGCTGAWSRHRHQAPPSSMQTLDS